MDIIDICNSNKKKRSRYSYDEKWKNGSYYYNSNRWKRLRNQIITQSPLCRDCMNEGRSVAAEELHHEIPFMRGKTEEERWNLLLDPMNITPLCVYHHLERHRKLNTEDKDADNDDDTVDFHYFGS